MLPGCWMPRRGIPSRPPIAAQSTPAKQYSRDAAFQFRKEKHGGELVAQLRQQRDEGRLLDCVVAVGAAQIRAHKALLAAFSPYFDGLLRFQQTQQAEPQSVYRITYDEVDPKSVERVVEFAYSGELSITHDNVRALLRAADFLCVSSVSTACCEYIKGTVDEKDALDVLHFAMKLNNSDLISHTRQFIARHLTDIASTDNFFAIEPELLTEILKDDEVVLIQKYMHESSVSQFFVMADKQEEMLVRHILLYEEKTQTGALPQLLKEGIRLCLISTPALTALKAEKLITSSPECLALLDRAVEIKGLGAAAGGESSAGGAGVGELCRDELYRRWTSQRALSGLKTLASNELATVSLQGYEAGREACELFSDAPPQSSVLYVTGMKLYSRRWDGRVVIGGMLVKYSSGKQLLHGSDDYGYEVGEFDLDPDERVIKVIVHSGWMVDGFNFVSNKGRTFGPYGGQGGSVHELAAPGKSGYLSHFTGAVEATQQRPAVRHLCFVWAYDKHDYTGTIPCQLPPACQDAMHLAGMEEADEVAFIWPPHQVPPHYDNPEDLEF